MTGDRARAVLWGKAALAAVTSLALAVMVVADPVLADPAAAAVARTAPVPALTPAMSKDAKPQSPSGKQGKAVGQKSRSAEATLEQVAFSELPGWESDDHLAAFKTFLKSCDKVIKSAARAAGGKPTAQCKVVPGALAATCHAAQALSSPTKVSAKAFFEEHFAPYRVAQEKQHGLLTGYYEPVMEGSRTRQGKFQTPIYRRPRDLVNVVAEQDRASKQQGFTHLRQTVGGDVPFPTRAEIEQGALSGKGLELIYLADPVETFFMHIQGSGRIHLTDGTTIRIGYDGKNGHPYSSIGRYLIDSGMLDANKVSMQALGKWLRADTARGQQVMWQNKSFIFFRELGDAEGPLGAMSVPLTPGRSLAVDTAFHTLGTPLYVSAPELSHATKGGFNRLMVAQDVGSAIKGPERGDIYFGSGDAAGKLAGVTKHAGNFFVLQPLDAPAPSVEDDSEAAGRPLIRFGEHLPWRTTAKVGE